MVWLEFNNNNMSDGVSEGVDILTCNRPVCSPDEWPTYQIKAPFSSPSVIADRIILYFDNRV